MKKPQGFMRHSEQTLVQPSASFNSWLWLKFHDSVLVVAEGALIDRRESYCALASCRLKKREEEIRGRPLQISDSSLAQHTFQVAFHKPEGFHLFSL